MKIYRAKDYEDMSRKAATIISAQMIMKPDCVLGLATGSTPVGLYKELVLRYERGELDFSNVTTFNLDEYVGLGEDNNQSYRYYMNRNLFNHVNIPREQTNVLNGMAEDGEVECERYSAKIAERGGIDLQLLGLGHNGHIGFNEPDSVFTTNTHCVQLAESTMNANARFFRNPEEVPQKAYTMGIGDIMKARKIVIVVSGKDKAEIVKKAFWGEVTPRVPVSVLQLHPDVSLVADEAALSLV